MSYVMNKNKPFNQDKTIDSRMQRTRSHGRLTRLEKDADGMPVPVPTTEIREGRRRQVKTIGKAVAGVALGIGVLNGAVRVSGPDNPQARAVAEWRQDFPVSTPDTPVTVPRESIEANALAGEMTLESGTLTLRSGVRVRTEPAIINDTVEQGDNSNVAFQVLENQTVTVMDPIKITTESGGFYGFTMEGEPMTDAQGNPARPVYWVSARVLQETDTTGTAFAVFEEASAPQNEDEGWHVVHDVGDGFLYANAAETKGGPIAQASIVEQSLQ